MDGLVNLVIYEEITIDPRVDRFNVLRVAFNVSQVSPLSGGSNVKECGSLALIPSTPRDNNVIPIHDNDRGVRFVVLFAFQ